MRELEQIILSLLLMATSGFIATNIYFLIVYSELTIAEPNPYIRVTEFVLTLAIFGFAIYRLIAQSLSLRKRL